MKTKKLRSYSPLRYPGGKGQIYHLVVKLIDENDVQNCTYIEPFAGGAGIAIRLLYEDRVKKIVINDYDRSIYAVWHSILYQTEDFINLIRNTPITMDVWYQQKKIQLKKDSVDLLTLGFSTFFLNRTNRSGIIKAGVIGGVNQDGNYKMDCRFNKDSLIDLIEIIAGLRDRIDIYNLDAVILLETINREKNQLYFIDPPYYKKGKDLYTNFFTHEDHQFLHDYIADNLSKKRLLISYDNCSEIISMYTDFLQKTVELKYYVETKRTGEEVFMTKNLII